MPVPQTGTDEKRLTLMELLVVIVCFWLIVIGLAVTW